MVLNHLHRYLYSSFVQVENITARLPSNDGEVRKSSMNLADEVQTLLTQLTRDDEDFVQAVNVQLRQSPSVIGCVSYIRIYLCYFCFR